MRVRLARVEAVDVRSSSEDFDQLNVFVTVDEALIPRLCRELREFTQTFDPQDFDTELTAAHDALKQIQKIKYAITSLCRFYDAGDRGTALLKAVHYLQDVVIETGVL